MYSLVIFHCILTDWARREKATILIPVQGYNYRIIFVQYTCIKLHDGFNKLQQK